MTVAALIAAIVTVAPCAAAEPEDEIPILTDSKLASAVVVKIEGRCSEVKHRSPEAMVRWSIKPDAAERPAQAKKLIASTEFRVDISKFPGGLEIGKYESVMVSRDESSEERNLKAGPSTALERAVLVRDLEPGVYYRSRVLARTAEGWVASAEVGFLSPICPFDGLDEE